MSTGTVIAQREALQELAETWEGLAEQVRRYDGENRLVRVLTVCAADLREVIGPGPTDSGQGYVYAIQEASGERHVKVGFSRNPSRRLADLQGASAVPLELVHVWPGGRTEERRLHRHLRDHRLEGEWFTAPALPELERLMRGREA